MSKNTKSVKNTKETKLAEKVAKTSNPTNPLFTPRQDKSGNVNAADGNRWIGDDLEVVLATDDKTVLANAKREHAAEQAALESRKSIAGYDRFGFKHDTRESMCCLALETLCKKHKDKDGRSVPQSQKAIRAQMLVQFKDVIATQKRFAKSHYDKLNHACKMNVIGKTADNNYFTFSDDAVPAPKSSKKAK